MKKILFFVAILLFVITWILPNDVKAIDSSAKNFTFSDELLPDAVIDKTYFHKINFNYSGKGTVLIKFYDMPEYFDFLNLNTSNNYFEFELITRKAGNFSFKADATVNGVLMASGTFYLFVDDPNNPDFKTQKIIKKPSIYIKKEVSKNTKNTIKNDKSKIKIEPKVETIPEPIPEPVKKLKWYQKVFNWFW